MNNSGTMSQHEPFSFRSSADLIKKAEELGIELPFNDAIDSLFENITIDSKKIPNRFAVQPMEGFDAERDGSPSELTFRRYRRYGEGGSGLIWFEATSVVSEGRSNPRQLILHTESLDGFKHLVEQTRRSAQQVFGDVHEAFLVLQLTHSGRYSKPKGKPEPQTANLNPYLDKNEESVHVLSDRELNRLQDKYIEVSFLAFQAGFDAVDIKACNGYLINELLAAHTRTNSSYGESFENRTRFLTEILQRIRDEIPGIGLAVRLNAYDGIPSPYGFGVSKDSTDEIDLTEPKALVRQLAAIGCSLFNITMGNPYLKPHLGRPFDRPIKGSRLPEEHPLEGVSRLLEITKEFQKEFPELPFVGTGYSWFRQYFPYVGAAVIDRGEASFVGLGRSSFAYPDAPKDLIESGIVDSEKVCITCSRCTELLRNLHIVGCVTRDKDIYGKEYKRLK